MFFDKFESLIADYCILIEDIYNMDGSGFLMAVIKRWKVIKIKCTNALRTRDPTNCKKYTIIKFVY
jgi:hypothetical protein